MNKKLLVFVLAVMFFAGFGITVSAESSSVTGSASVSNEKLLEKIAELQAQIKALTQKNEALTQKLELARQLRTGAQGNDVVTLQKILATDRTIYPEGLETGFFGERTKEAIKRLQTKFGLVVTGELDEKTKELINKILTSQGVSKDIPPGLLIAPGLRDRVRVKLENKDGKFEYRIEVGDDSDDSDDDDDDDDDSDDDGDDNSKLEIEIEKKSNDRSKVKIDWRHDGKRFKRVMFLNTQNESEIVEKVANLLGLDQDVVKAAISSDDDDDDSNDDDDDDDSDDDNGGRHGGDDDDDDSDED